MFDQVMKGSNGVWLASHLQQCLTQGRSSQVPTGDDSPDSKACIQLFD
jgi:hypothetical protein